MPKLKNTWKLNIFFLVLCLDTPDCHNQNPETYFDQNITLDCTIQFQGYRMPSVDWRLGTLKLNSTTEIVQNRTVMIETLTMMASEHMNGYVYHCHVEYPGLVQIECMALPSLLVYSKQFVIFKISSTFTFIYIFLLFRVI